MRWLFGVLVACGRRVSVLKTEEYLKERARRGSQEHALGVLDRVADIEPQLTEEEALPISEAMANEVGGFVTPPNYG